MTHYIVTLLVVLVSTSALSEMASGDSLRQPKARESKAAATLESMVAADGLYETRRQGMLVFTTPFTKKDGFGDGPFDPAETPSVGLGHRPTLQGNGTLLRVNGLDSQSCNECHTIVSANTRPPTLGIGGVGGAAQNAIILPTMVDVGDSEDDRVSFVAGHFPDMQLLKDGVADFNGRFANPPFLFGGGGVELLGKEMTADLQGLLAEARADADGTVTPLETHGVSFGELLSIGGGDVDLSNVEGVGPEDLASVTPEEALVVRPYGRKGEFFTMRDFDRGAMQFHFGIQPVEVVGEGVDEDGDGVVNEITVQDMTKLHVFDVTNPRPRQTKQNAAAQAGQSVFSDIGCADCHRPNLFTRSRRLPLAFPEIAEDPSANIYIRINLENAGFVRSGSGVVVPLFSDLKRHDMGPGLAESFEIGEIANEEFITARLWGIADTAPYLHDGRATSLAEAIEAHGGEAQAARDTFVALSPEGKDDLLAFLGTLRAPKRPNEELIGDDDDDDDDDDNDDDDNDDDDNDDNDDD